MSQLDEKHEGQTQEKLLHITIPQIKSVAAASVFHPAITMYEIKQQPIYLPYD